MMNTTKRPGPESTLASVREQLFDTGVRLLAAKGVDLAFDDVSLSQTIEAAGVTRSTAYRSLADESLSPQMVLHREVQRMLLERHHQPETMTRVQAAITELLESEGEVLERGDVISRTRLLRDIIRVGGNESYLTVVESTERAILTSLYGALRSSGHSDWRTPVVTRGELMLNEMFTQLYRELTQLFHYEIKPGYTFEQLAAAGSGLIEGIAMRHDLNPHTHISQLPTGSDGELQDWSLFSIAFEKVVIGMVQPCDRDNPFADLLNH